MALVHVNRFAKAFPQTAKTEGSAQFANGHTRINGDDDCRVSFSVDGQTCHFEIRGKITRIACTCTEACQGIPCGHLWACISFLEETPCLFSHSLKYSDALELNPEAFGLERLKATPVPVDTPTETDAPLAQALPSALPFPTISPAPDEDRRNRAMRFIYTIEAEMISRPDGCFVERLLQENDGRNNWRIIHGTAATTEFVDEIGTELDHLLNCRFSDANDGLFELDLFESAATERICINEPSFSTVIDPLCRTGRFFRKVKNELTPLYLCTTTLSPKLHVGPRDGDELQVRASLQAGDESLALNTFETLLNSGFAIAGNTLCPYSCNSAALGKLLRQLQKTPTDRTNLIQLESLLNQLTVEDVDQYVDMDDSLGFKKKTARPKPVLEISEHRVWQPRQRLAARISFDYDGSIVKPSSTPHYSVNFKQAVMIRRETAQENQYLDSFRAHKQVQSDSLSDGLVVKNDRLMDLMGELGDNGWDVQWSGNHVLRPQHPNFAISCADDTIIISATMTYGKQTVTFTEMLKHWNSGRYLFPLESGQLAMLPSDWLNQREFLANLGTAKKDGTVHFKRAQAPLVEHLISGQEHIDIDDAFYKLRDDLVKIETLRELEVPPGFNGTLRPYQQEGFAWLYYLYQLGLGACLADDMGLGKTVQTLAFLEYLRVNHRPRKPHLLIVPRSLLGNWEHEAATFTPDLRVMIHHGAGRAKSFKGFAGQHLVITTYGTMIRDLEWFAEHKFHCCILDEAQAIKNAQSQSSKAVRQLSTRHRIALSGTPIENHLGEIWSIFEFLNPGILGKNRNFSGILNSKEGPTEGEIDLISKALSPFMLRRHKEMVEKDLPEKQIITVYCDLEADHAKAYEDLRNEYQMTMKGKVKKGGLNKSKIYILEALMRLRQCASHPRLASELYAKVTSSKFEALLTQLCDVIEEGHRALVFSQFTSLLQLLKPELTSRGINYQYLDGQTRKRMELVDQFQQNADIPVFLISLKAGGAGLNLTAADYVFILDPWWNPAAEAQAIDRTHRIGQTRPVIAYRYIARNTIEERVEQLQHKKRDLADALMGNARSLMQELTEDELDNLLS